MTDIVKDNACSAVLTLKKGEGRTIKAGGSWIYDNEVDRIEGEYKDGKPDGFGKKYDKDGNLVFEGEIFKRERMGRKRKNRRIR